MCQKCEELWVIRWRCLLLSWFIEIPILFRGLRIKGGEVDGAKKTDARKYDLTRVSVCVRVNYYFLFYYSIARCNSPTSRSASAVRGQKGANSLRIPSLLTYSISILLLFQLCITLRCYTFYSHYTPSRFSAPTVKSISPRDFDICTPHKRIMYVQLYTLVLTHMCT